jgi:diadenosine tetraphosphatase ApaH/serine/threonine PP2A family protein phosphatase
MENLTRPSLEFLRGLRRTARTGAFHMAHGSLREPTTEYLTGRAQARASFELCNDQVVLVGHTHVPLSFVDRETEDILTPATGTWISYQRRRLIYNPGAVGQPRDGDHKAAYAIIDTSTAKIGQFRTEYEVEAARQEIVDAGLPRALGDRLSIGR